MATKTGPVEKMERVETGTAVAARAALTARPIGLIVLAVVLAVSVSLPFFMSGFRLFQFTQVLI